MRRKTPSTITRESLRPPSHSPLHVQDMPRLWLLSTSLAPARRPLLKVVCLRPRRCPSMATVWHLTPFSRPWFPLRLFSPARPPRLLVTSNLPPRRSCAERLRTLSYAPEVLKAMTSGGGSVWSRRRIWLRLLVRSRACGSARRRTAPRACLVGFGSLAWFSSS